MHDVNGYIDNLVNVLGLTSKRMILIPTLDLRPAPAHLYTRGGRMIDPMLRSVDSCTKRDDLVLRD